MKPVLLALVAILGLNAAASAQEAAPAPAALRMEAVPAVMEKAVDGFIRPGDHRFREGVRESHLPRGVASRVAGLGDGGIDEAR